MAHHAPLHRRSRRHLRSRRWHKPPAPCGTASAHVGLGAGCCVRQWALPSGFHGKTIGKPLEIHRTMELYPFLIAMLNYQRVGIIYMVDTYDMNLI